MEAAQALNRGSFSTYLEAVREMARSRSRVFWTVAGLTVLAAAIRFATLGVQAYHHDEVVTASRVLRGSFLHAMDAVGFSESAPPLYYALAWVWTQVTGTGEFGLRSLSAVAGVATVPVAYLLGVELRGRRTGIAAAALVAVNPMLVWYSQEARVYALLALLVTLSALYFVRSLERGERRDFIAWGLAAGLALATHYFAIFPIGVEALWLLYRRGRRSIPGIAILGGTALLLAPLAIHQMSAGRAEWISNYGLGHRLWEAGMTALLGETSDIIARPERPELVVLPALIAAVALVLILIRGSRDERRAAAIPLALAGVTVAVPVVVGIVDSSKDYVLARNLMPALVPMLVVLAIGLTLRGARRIGTVLCTALVAYSLGFCVWASLSPTMQRPDWDAVASNIGEPTAPRAMVTWALGEASLRYYLSTGSYQVLPSDGFGWFVHEVDLISDGPAPPPSAHLLGPGFRQVAYEKVGGRLYVRSYAMPGPDLAPLRLRAIRKAELNFRNNGVLLDGIGPE
jgi:mannosyltransferase